MTESILHGNKFSRRPSPEAQKFLEALLTGRMLESPEGGDLGVAAQNLPIAVGPATARAPADIAPLLFQHTGMNPKNAAQQLVEGNPLADIAGFAMKQMAGGPSGGLAQSIGQSPIVTGALDRLRGMGMDEILSGLGEFATENPDILHAPAAMGMTILPKLRRGNLPNAVLNSQLRNAQQPLTSKEARFRSPSEAEEQVNARAQTQRNLEEGFEPGVNFEMRDPTRGNVSGRLKEQSASGAEISPDIKPAGFDETGEAIKSANRRRQRAGHDVPGFHGTKTDISDYDPGVRGSATGAASAREAFFFSKNSDTAESYAFSQSTPSEAQILEAEKAHQLIRAESAEIQLRTKDNRDARGVLTRRWGHEMKDATNSGLLSGEAKIMDEVRSPGSSGDLAVQEWVNDNIPEFEQKKYKELLADVEEDLERSRVLMQQELHVGYGEAVQQVQLRMQRPLVVDFAGDDYREADYFQLIRAAKDGGFDSVIFRNTFDGGDMDDIYAVWDPSSIQSKFSKFEDAAAAGKPLTPIREIPGETAVARQGLSDPKTGEAGLKSMPDTGAFGPGINTRKEVHLDNLLEQQDFLERKLRDFEAGGGDLMEDKEMYTNFLLADAIEQKVIQRLSTQSQATEIARLKSIPFNDRFARDRFNTEDLRLDRLVKSRDERVAGSPAMTAAVKRNRLLDKEAAARGKANKPWQTSAAHKKAFEDIADITAEELGPFPRSTIDASQDRILPEFSDPTSFMQGFRLTTPGISFAQAA